MNDGQWSYVAGVDPFRRDIVLPDGGATSDRVVAFRNILVAQRSDSDIDETLSNLYTPTRLPYRPINWDNIPAIVSYNGYIRDLEGLRERMFGELGINECMEESTEEQKEPEIYMKYKEVFS